MGLDDLTKKDIYRLLDMRRIVGKRMDDVEYRLPSSLVGSTFGPPLFRKLRIRFAVPIKVECRREKAHLKDENTFERKRKLLRCWILFLKYPCIAKE
jgi:hypothetical protein